MLISLAGCKPNVRLIMKILTAMHPFCTLQYLQPECTLYSYISEQVFRF